MPNKPSLFRNEEEVLKRAAKVIEQFQEQDSLLLKEYKILLKDYNKLFKQTKFLVKISDMQQNRLSDRAEGLESSNLELQQKAEEAEAAVRVSEKRLAQFLEAVSMGVFVVDAQGQPYYANQKAKQILGKDIISSSTLKPLPEIYQPYLAGTTQLYPQDQQPLVQALKGKIYHVDDVEIHRDNKIIPLEVWGTPIFDERGNIAYAIAVFQDITDRKQAEEERSRFTQQLTELNLAYERFVPREFLSLLDKQSVVDINLGDQVEKEMTILFSDIRDFTTLSETMTPQDNFEFINAYLGQMEPIIHQHQGFIDKYIGDAIMALFPSSADDAVSGAIAMLTALTRYNQILQTAEFQPLKIGIGIHTGALMLGTVGGQDRMDGTVISDAVNSASRIEDLTKIYGVKLLISETTYSRLQDTSQYAIRTIDRVRVKGKTAPITIYEVFNSDSPYLFKLKKQTLADFEQGLKHYRQKQFLEAQNYFQKILSISADDQAVRLYLKRCKHFQQEGVPDDWEDVKEVVESEKE